MLHHLYGLDYEELYRFNPLAVKPTRKPIFVFGTNAISPLAQEKTPNKEIAPDIIASFQVKMYIIGDKYDIPTLRSAAKQRFKKLVDSHAQELAIIPLIKAIYEGTSAGDDGLRGTIIKVTIRQLSLLRENPEFDNVLQNQSDFTYDMSRAMMEKVIKC